MKCKNCSKEYAPKRSTSLYCTDQCRLAFHRREVSVSKGEDKVSVSLFSYVHDQVVYGRPAVGYEGDKFRTRPEPLDVTDTPCPRNRGRYTRQYQFDCLGHDFPLTDGLLYQTIEEVRACYV